MFSLLFDLYINLLPIFITVSTVGGLYFGIKESREPPKYLEPYTPIIVIINNTLAGYICGLLYPFSYPLLIIYTLRNNNYEIEL